MKIEGSMDVEMDCDGDDGVILCSNCAKEQAQ